MSLFLLPSHWKSNSGHSVTSRSPHKSPHVYSQLQSNISSSHCHFAVLRLPSYGRPCGPSIFLHASCNQSITRAVKGRDGRRIIGTLLTCKVRAPIQLSVCLSVCLSVDRYWQQQLTAPRRRQGAVTSGQQKNDVCSKCTLFRLQTQLAEVRIQMTSSLVQNRALVRHSLLSDFHTVSQFTIKSSYVCTHPR